MGPDQYLNSSYRLVTLRQAIAWIGAGNGMKIHNPLNCAEILGLNEKAARKARFENSLFYKWILIYQ